MNQFCTHQKLISQCPACHPLAEPKPIPTGQVIDPKGLKAGELFVLNLAGVPPGGYKSNLTHHMMVQAAKQGKTLPLDLSSINPMTDIESYPPLKLSAT